MLGKLDRLDMRLLACLQEDNLQTADALAEKVGRSPSAVARRLRRLRATGAVAADVALVSEEAAGYPLSAIVHLQLERHAQQEVDCCGAGWPPARTSSSASTLPGPSTYCCSSSPPTWRPITPSPRGCWNSPRSAASRPASSSGVSRRRSRCRWRASEEADIAPRHGAERQRHPDHRRGAQRARLRLYLAERGLKVTMLETRSVVGGAAVTEEFHPGFRNSTAATRSACSTRR